MKSEELREKSTEELEELLQQLEDMGFRLRLQHYTGQLKRVSSLGATRKEIARVKTVLRERQLLSEVRSKIERLENPAAPGALRAEAAGSERLKAEHKKLRRQQAQLSRIVGEA